ncbi:MAG: class I SAM-dependent methyltransferase [Lautropia sp.]
MKGPVGIISHWNDGAVHSGPAIPALVKALENGQNIEALMDCLAFPKKFPLQGRLTRAGLWPTAISARAGLALTRSGLKGLIGRPPGEVVAQDIFEFFFSRRSGNNPYNAVYFLNRFAIPRYLSAMSLVQRFEASDRPVLDIACGYGHFGHYLTRRRRLTPAIGIDINFYQVWGAKHWVAPDAWFVCCDAGDGLPFKTGSCSGTFCSDAFPYISRKALLVEEVERVAPKRPAVYARVGNREVNPPNPRHGGELRPDEYWNLFGRDQSRYFAHSALWKDYLMRRSPLDREAVSLADLRWEKYLTYVTHPEALSSGGEPVGVWPHGVGELVLNPALTIVAENQHALFIEFMYRTIWGAYEDADMMAYTEREGKIDKAELRAALSDPDSAAASRLIGRFILIGAPDHYLRKAGRPSG